MTHLHPLIQKIERQVKDWTGKGTVEILTFLDNRMRTIGEKRDALVQMSRGRFVAFCDDDDDVTETYVAELLNAIAMANEDVSVITFDQLAIINGVQAVCSFSLSHPNEPFKAPGFRRNAWHVCAWRGEMARKVRFPATNYGEDWAWAKHLVIDAKNELRIPRVLHVYRYDPVISEAPPPPA